MIRAILLVFVGLLTSACLTWPDAPRRPNVLFLAVDDLRPELGCYGIEYASTPHLDRLAASGVLFERAYCQQAVCNPSRASVMTGLRPETLGVLDLKTDFRTTKPDAVTIGEHFQQHGYSTWAIGKIFHNIFPDERTWSEPKTFLDGYPFDPDAVYVAPENMAALEARKEQIRANGREARFIDRFGQWYLKHVATEAPDVADRAYYDGAQTDFAIEQIERFAGGGQPFFAAVGFYRPHLPFNAPKRYWDLYDRDAIPLPDPAGPVEGAPPMAINNMRELRGYADFRGRPQPHEGPLTEEEIRLLRHGYLASVSYVDAQVGRVLDTLDQRIEDDCRQFLGPERPFAQLHRRFGAHHPLEAGDGFFRMGGHPVECGRAAPHLARTVDRHGRGRQQLAERIRHQLRTLVAPDSDGTVGGAEIDSDQHVLQKTPLATCLSIASRASVSSDSGRITKPRQQLLPAAVRRAPSARRAAHPAVAPAGSARCR